MSPAALLVALLLAAGLPAAQQERLAQQLGARLRCPVCQGMPIGESPSPMAQDMMQQVREQLKEGRTATEVEQYYVERYGEWVLLQPPLHGFNWLLWLLPPVALLLLGLTARRRRGDPAPASASASAADTDIYAQAIAAELRDEHDA